MKNNALKGSGEGNPIHPTEVGSELIKYSDCPRSCSMVGQRAGFAERLVLSRKIRMVRIRYQGFANRLSDDCSDDARDASDA